MKKIPTLLTTAWILLCMVNMAYATPPSSNINCLSVNGELIKINELQTELNNTSKGVIYHVEFSIPITTNNNFKQVMAIFNDIKNNAKTFSVDIRKYVQVQKISDISTISELWNYQYLEIEEIILPTLDASLKQSANIKIKFIAYKATAAYQVKNDVKLTSLMEIEKKAFSANYSFQLEGLPCRNISKISSVNISVPESKNITITISQRDIAAWNEAMAQNPTKIYNGGKIIYLSPTLKDNIFMATLNRVKIVSIRSLQNSEASIQRYEITLSFETVSFEKK